MSIAIQSFSSQLVSVNSQSGSNLDLVLPSATSMQRGDLSSTSLLACYIAQVLPLGMLMLAACSCQLSRQLLALDEHEPLIRGKADYSDW